MSYRFGHADEEQKRYLEAEAALAPKTKITDIIVTLTLVLLVFGFGIAFFVLPDRAFSENENRALETAPEMTLKTVASGEFTEKFSSYFTDQFPLRDTFIGIKAACELALGKNENNGVLLGGGYLISRMDEAAAYSSYRDSFEGTAAFTPKYSAAKERTVGTLTENAAAIMKFKEAAEKAGIPVTFAAAGRLSDLASGKAGIYPDSADDYAWAALDGTGAEYVDLLTPLKAHFDAGEYVYYRTDHHWTTLGAYYAYREIMDAFGEAANEIEHYRRETVSDSFYGTTWSSSGIRFVKPDVMEYFHIDGDEDGRYEVDLGSGEVRASLYDRTYLGKKDKYSSFISDNRARTDIKRTDGEDRETLLVIKDSFGMSLAPFLAEHYNIVMLDLRYFRMGTASSIIESENVSRVLVIYNMDSLSTDPTIAMISAGVR